MEESKPTLMNDTLGTSFVTRVAASELTHPLDAFYARHNIPLPPLETVDGEAVPEPFKGLLVHPNDMTSTLEDFYHDSIEVQVMGHYRHDHDYFR